MSEILYVAGAMTFLRPWAEAIVRPVPEGATAPSPKRIENRSHPPPFVLCDRWVALHTGKGTDAQGLAWLRETFCYPWTMADAAPAGQILGLMRISGWVEATSPRGFVWEHSFLAHPLAVCEAPPWWLGPVRDGKPNYGWIIADVIAFEQDPVPVARGQLGIWRLGADALAGVQARVGALRPGAEVRNAR